jgi:3-deoxy-D-manno-octulosonate 8-phosphate phosphatase (KDO 8-P phosphatase)
MATELTTILYTAHQNKLAEILNKGLVAIVVNKFSSFQGLIKRVDFVNHCVLNHNSPNRTFAELIKQIMGFKELLPNVKAMVFDVDGVLSTSTIALFPNCEKVRIINTKDGYGLYLAATKGILLAIISGGLSEAIHDQYTRLGFTDIYTGVSEKTVKLDEFINKHKLERSEVLYMGDDIPDYEVMTSVGIPVCPSDASPEIKAVSVYVSKKKGGYGCVRDVVEQVLKAQGHWMNGEKAFNW